MWTDKDTRRYNFNNYIKPAILGIMAAVVIAAIGLYSVNKLDEASCRSYGEVTGREVRYRPLGGCFIKTDAGYMSQDEFKSIMLILVREGRNN